MLYSVLSSFWTEAPTIPEYGWISTQLGPPAKGNIASVQGGHFFRPMTLKIGVAQMYSAYLRRQPP